MREQRYPLSQRKIISFSSEFSGPWDDSVRRPASSLSPTTHLASSQEIAVRGRYLPAYLWPVPFGIQGVQRGCLRTRYLLYHPALLPFAAPSQVRRLRRWSCLHGVWRRSSCRPAHLAGSCAQFNSAAWFSSPGNLPRSTPFSRLRWQSRTPLSCARRLLSSWQRMELKCACVAPGRDAADLSFLPPAVVETITQARAPLTRQTYALKWSLFANWCSSRREDPWRCTIGVVLSFLQERLEHRMSPSTLKVCVKVYSHHDAVDGRSLGKHDLIVRFL